MEKGRLKQKSHFQTTSLHHSAKSLTLKRHNPKRAVYRKPFASSHFSKSSTLILPPFSSKSSLLTCLPLLYFAKTVGPPSSYCRQRCICFGIRPVGGRLKPDLRFFRRPLAFLPAYNKSGNAEGDAMRWSNGQVSVWSSAAI